MDWRTAWAKWQTEFHPQKPCGYAEAVSGTKQFMDWYMSEAKGVNEMSSKQREALSDACYAMFNFLKTHYGSCYEEMANALDKAKAALAEPIRNCDVGTAEEQAERFHSFCKTHQSGIQGMCSSQCPCKDCCDTCHCLTKWSQMPYEEGGANDYSHNQQANGND